MPNRNLSRFQCFIQLQKPSDKSTSEALPFEYLPLDKGRRSIYALRKGLRLKQNAEKLSALLTPSVSKELDPVHANGIGLNDEPAEKRTPNSTDFVSVPTESVADVEMVDAKVEESNRKATAWLQQTEFVPLGDEVDKAIGGANIARATPTSQNSFDDQRTVTARSDISNDDEDRTLNELLEQVAELDEIYSGYQMQRTGKLAQKCSFDDMSFDDAATYTSLQRAFKNPVLVPMPSVDSPRLSPIDDSKYDVVEPIVNPVGPVINISPKNQVEEEKLPPLPPKRLRKLTAENTEFNATIRDVDADSVTSSPERPVSQIIIKRTPDQLPLKNNRSPATSNPSSSTSSPQKKPGFFSRIFRRKSKSDINSDAAINLNASPDVSRDPSINEFDVGNRNRLTTRSFRSPQSPTRRGKPVGRSVSSVSGKRPHLTADIIHIPLKGLSTDSLPMKSGSGNLIPDHYASHLTLSNQLDRKTVSALQLADLPIQDGNMELIAIADAQSLKNLCEGKYGVRLDDDVDLTEAEHFALYTSVAPHATASEFDDASAFYVPVDGGEILSNEEIAKRLASGGKIEWNTRLSIEILFVSVFCWKQMLAQFTRAGLDAKQILMIHSFKSTAFHHERWLLSICICRSMKYRHVSVTSSQSIRLIRRRKKHFVKSTYASPQCHCAMICAVDVGVVVVGNEIVSDEISVLSTDRLSQGICFDAFDCI